MDSNYKEKPNTNYNKILICEDEKSVLPDFDLVILWNDFYSLDSNIISLSKYVELNAEYYRSLYLSWVYNFSKSRINGVEVSDYLKLEKEFKYWPLTSIAQKFNISDTSFINDSIKLFALERIILDNLPEEIHVNLDSDIIRLTIKEFCKKSRIKCIQNTHKCKFRLNKYVHAIFLVLKAFLFFLKYAFNYLIINYNNSRNKYYPSGQISFIDILVHFDRKAFANGFFISNYWTKLVDKMSELKIDTNWVHTYYEYNNNATFSEARKSINQINSRNINEQHHSIFESSLSFDVFLSSLLIYLETLFKSIRLSFLNKKYYSPLNSNLNFELLFKKEFMESLLGPNKILNIIRFKLYPKFFKKFPKQKLGFYLQEFQPWESILVYTWKKMGFGDIIGVPHSTIRFWDLRYFFDSNIFKDRIIDYYFPDKIAVNGNIAKQLLIKSNFQHDILIEVEALRYLHLINKSNTNNSFKKKSNEFYILICGDFLESTNKKILTKLTDAINFLNLNLKIYFKPHPAFSFNPFDINQNIIIIEDNLENILENFDIVITSNISSSSVDAYAKGIPVIQYLDGKYFNMTPLRDNFDIGYFSNSIELLRLLSNFKQKNSFSNNFFYLELEIPKWIRLIQFYLN